LQKETEPVSEMCVIFFCILKHWMVNEVKTLSGAKGGMSTPAPYENSSQEIGHYCKHHCLFVLGDGDA